MKILTSLEITDILIKFKTAFILYLRKYEKIFQNSNSVFTLSDHLLGTKERICQLVNTVNHNPLLQMINNNTINSFSQTFTIRTCLDGLKNKIHTLEVNHLNVPLVLNDGNEFIDCRVFGGGVLPSYLNEHIGKDMSLYSLTDIGKYDGIPTTASTNMVVYIPVISTTVNNVTTYTYLLDPDKLNETLEKYKAAGTTVYFKHYTISSTNLSTSDIANL